MILNLVDCFIWSQSVKPRGRILLIPVFSTNPLLFVSGKAFHQNWCVKTQNLHSWHYYRKGLGFLWVSICVYLDLVVVKYFVHFGYLWEWLRWHNSDRPRLHGTKPNCRHITPKRHTSLFTTRTILHIRDSQLYLSAADISFKMWKIESECKTVIISSISWLQSWVISLLLCWDWKTYYSKVLKKWQKKWQRLYVYYISSHL